MNIKTFCYLKIVSTKLKPYKYTRKGFFRGDKWIKPKRYTKYKRVPIKKPYLQGSVLLNVYNERLVIGGVYTDPYGVSYFCDSSSDMISTLRAVQDCFGSEFRNPNKIVLVSSQCKEG